MATKFSIERSMPSCEVDLALLKEIQSYVLRNVSSFTGIPQEKVASEWELTISDGVGKETIKSIEDYSSAHLPNTTESIKANLRVYDEEHIRANITISLSTTARYSRADIQFTSENAKEKCEGVSSGLFQVASKRRNYHWLFHGISIEVVKFITFLVLPFLTIILWPKNKMLGWTFACATAMGILILLGISSHPYCAFDTPRYRQRKKLWTWTFLSVLGFCLVTSAGTGIRRQLLGW